MDIWKPTCVKQRRKMGTILVNIRMYNDMRFLDWHQHLVLWAKSHVSGLLNSIKYQFFPRRQNQARGRTDAPVIRSTFSRTFLNYVTLQCIVEIVTGNANYVSLPCNPWTSQSGKCAWPEVPVQKARAGTGPAIPLMGWRELKFGTNPRPHWAINRGWGEHGMGTSLTLGEKCKWIFSSWIIHFKVGFKMQF